MDFVDKKDRLAELVETYARDKNDENYQSLISFIDELSSDEDFNSKELFTKLFDELKRFSSDLTSRELKQRALMIKTYMD